MKLERLHVQGYRSLYDVDFRPHDLSVLVGPNNSGKTNFVEAVDFLAEAYRHGLEVAVNRKGGIENIAHRRMRRTRRLIAFDTTVSLTPDEIHPVYYQEDDARDTEEWLADIDSVHVQHSFAFRSLGQAIEADYEIEQESIQVSIVREGISSRLLGLTRRPGDVTIDLDRIPSRRNDLRSLVRPFDIKDFRQYISRGVSRSALLNETAPYSAALQTVWTALSQTRLYQLVPLEGRRPGVPTPNAEVERHGTNLPAMVAYLQRHDPNAWDEIRRLMMRIVPDLEDISTEFTPDRRLALQFVERGVRRAWSSEDVSDGTIQSLALFTALLDRRTPLLLIEEPENSIHPWIVRNFADACRSAKKQIIITTHSPVLISYLRPEDVYIVWRRDGRTQVSTLLSVDSEASSLWESGSLNLFELLDSGAIREAVPGEPT